MSEAYDGLHNTDDLGKGWKCLLYLRGNTHEILNTMESNCKPFTAKLAAYKEELYC